MLEVLAIVGLFSLFWDFCALMLKFAWEVLVIVATILYGVVIGIAAVFGAGIEYASGKRIPNAKEEQLRRIKAYLESGKISFYPHEQLEDELGDLSL